MKLDGMKLAAAAARFTRIGAVENFHAEHDAHLNNTLVAGDGGRFTCPACLTNKIYSRRFKVVKHTRRIAAKNS
jgi:hypothetical protein